MPVPSRVKSILIILACGVALLIGIIALLNASWLGPVPTGQPSMLAHRGVHQLYDRRNLDNDTCTATRMLPPTNPYLENTLASMQASFALGADILEIDIHPTTDGEFAVFHDWTVDCRTNGHGTVRELPMATLRTLDIGYGYTADGGKTFPFRGKGVGLMPTLAEVLRAFPARRFLLNFKSRDPHEAELLMAYLARQRIDASRQVMVYGNERPVNRWAQLMPASAGFSKEGLKQCTKDYALWGWTSHVPASCHGATIAVPLNWRKWIWGWPNRFIERMQRSGTTVILFGQVASGNGAPGLTQASELDAVPHGFPGIVWVDGIEAVGPAWQARHIRSSNTP